MNQILLSPQVVQELLHVELYLQPSKLTSLLVMVNLQVVNALSVVETQLLLHHSHQIILLHFSLCMLESLKDGREGSVAFGNGVFVEVVVLVVLFFQVEISVFMVFLVLQAPLALVVSAEEVKAVFSVALTLIKGAKSEVILGVLFFPLIPQLLKGLFAVFDFSVLGEVFGEDEIVVLSLRLK